MANLCKPTTSKPSTRQAIAMRNRTVIWKALAALVVTMMIGACSGSPHVRSITLTFIRHAESQTNADNVVNTDIPGPSLTEEGKAQAEQLAHQLSRNNFDGIYVSDMVRTQETAAPLAHALGKPVEVLPGLREIDAGWYNNTSTKRADLICSRRRIGSRATARTPYRARSAAMNSTISSLPPSRRSTTAVIPNPSRSRTAGPSCTGP